MPKPRSLPDQDYLRQCLDYDPVTSSLTWRERPPGHFKDERSWKIWNTRYRGMAVGGYRASLHIRVALDGVRYLSHRVIWKLATGTETPEIDHKNRDGRDNRWINLRVASRPQNQVNRSMQSNNTTGFRGVIFRKSSGRYLAQIYYDGKTKYLGSFTNAEEADKTYREFGERLHGEFWHEKAAQVAPDGVSEK